MSNIKFSCQEFISVFFQRYSFISVEESVLTSYYNENINWFIENHKRDNDLECFLDYAKDHVLANNLQDDIQL